MISDDGTTIHLFPFGGHNGNGWYSAPLELPVTGPINFTLVANNSDVEHHFVTSDGQQVYIMTNKNAPRYKLVRVDLSKPGPEDWVDIIPEHKLNVLSSLVAVDGDKVAALYMRDVSHIIQIYSLTDGSHIRDVDTPVGIDVKEMDGERNRTELFFKVVSFLNPGIIYKYDLKTGQQQVSSNNKISLIILMNC